MKKVIVIVGPTASGKTSRSIALAKKINSEIINGDSVQIYKELNIGSAKITKEAMQGIPHHLLNIRHVGEEYTVYHFQKDVRALIEKINVPIIVGGTGFYIKAALYNYEFEDFDNSFNYDHLTNDELYLKIINKDSNIEIDKNNRIRLIRALNMIDSGVSRSSKNKKDEPLYDILTIYLDYPRVSLKAVLKDRLELMIKQGLILETKSLNKHLNIIGYREISNYLNGEISLDEAKAQIISVSMKLAKKQKTWFKNQMNCLFFDALDENIDNLILKEVEKFLGDK